MSKKMYFVEEEDNILYLPLKQEKERVEKVEAVNSRPPTNAPYIVSTPYTIPKNVIKQGEQTPYVAPLIQESQNKINPNSVTLSKDLGDHNKMLEWKNQQGNQKIKGNDPIIGIAKTGLNTLVQAGKGIVDYGEGILDTGLQIGSSELNPFMHLLYDGDIKQGQDIAKEIIQEDASQNFIDNTLGYGKILPSGKTIQQTIDENSLVKSDNLGGQLFRSIGNMLPSIMIGNSGIGNAGQIGSYTSLGLNSYGGGLEEAYNDGANRKQANLYGIGSAGLEMGTEWITGGIPGTGGKTGLDNIAEKGLKKITNQALKETSKAGYKMAGEGVEEMASEYFNPYLKEFIYTGNKKDSVGQKILNAHNNVDWNAVKESGITGAISGGILEAPMNLSNIRNGIAKQKQINYNNRQIANLKSQQSAPISNKQNSIINEQISNLEQQNNILKGNENIDYENKNVQQDNNVNELFSKQIDEVINGTYPKRDMLVVSQNTPKVLQDIGLNDFPITMTQKHLYTMTHSDGKYADVNYHNIPIDIVKQLPSALEKPLNVLKSNTKNDSIVVVTELADKNGDIIVASIKLDGKGQINDINIDTNVMTSAYGKSGNYDYFMQDNIKKGNLLYDIDEGIINTINKNAQKKSSATDRLQLPMRSSDSNTISDIPKNISSIDNSNIPQFNNNVKVGTLPNKYSMQKNINNVELQQKSNIGDNILSKASQNAEIQIEQLSANNKKILNPNEISKLTLEDANTTPKLSNKKVKTGDGKSHFYENITEKTQMLSESTRNKLQNEIDIKYYKKVTNQESLDTAFKKLNEGGKNETLNWFTRNSYDSNGKFRSNPTPIDVAEGWILLKQYQDAGDYDSMVQVAKTMREIGTQAGQTIQAFNIMERLTPEGMVKYAQSELTEAYNKMVQDKSKKWIDNHVLDFELTSVEVEFIINQMKEISTMKEGYNKKAKLAEIQKMMQDKLPHEKGQALKSWMRISMLFNPKTQVRNVLGNALIAPVNAIGDVVSTGADKFISKYTGKRTTGLPNVKAVIEGIKRGAYESTVDYKKGINTKDMEGNRFEIGEGKSFNNKTLIGKSLNQVDGLLSYMLDVGDRVFSESIFENSLQNQMVLNNTTEITQEMIDIARAESLQKTWNDSNNYTRFVLNVRKGLNKIGIKGYGLGDVLIPFAKTPANLTKAIVDYSPAGLVSTLLEGNKLRKSLSNGQYNAQLQHKFVQNLGKATAGTILYILGYSLAKMGITTGENDEDKDTSNFLKNTLGVSSYSIKIGGKSFAYDWAQPLAAPLSITANMVNSKNKETALLESIVGSLDSAGSTLLEQSFLQSINDVLDNNDGVVSGVINEVLELPSRAIPTLSKQIVDLTDSTQRTSYEYKKPVESAINSIKAKIPGLSKTLSPVVDTMGREMPRYGGKNNIFNVFLNPSNVNSENISKSAKEIYDIYKSTGEKTIMPRVAPYYINQKGEKIILSSKQKADYQKISGEIIEKEVQNLLNNKEYKNLAKSDKATIIKSIVDYSYNKAREEVLDISMPNTYNKAIEYISKGGKISEYYLKKEEINFSLENPRKYNTIKAFNIDYDDYTKYMKRINELKDSNGSTENRKNAVFSYINSLNMPKNSKTALYFMSGYGISNYKNNMFQYINSLNLSKSEKEEIYYYLYPKKGSG